MSVRHGKATADYLLSIAAVELLETGAIHLDTLTEAASLGLYLPTFEADAAREAELLEEEGQ